MAITLAFQAKDAGSTPAIPATAKTTPYTGVIFSLFRCVLLARRYYPHYSNKCQQERAKERRKTMMSLFNIDTLYCDCLVCGYYGENYGVNACPNCDSEEIIPL